MNKIPAELVPARFSALVRSLYPELRELLASELAAGNIIVSVVRDVPHPGSIFVGLGTPFRDLPASLPAAVRRIPREAGSTRPEEIVAGPPLHTLAAPTK
jgi:hypothetical protein